MAIELTNEWNNYEIPFTLASPTSQIDVMVITKDKIATQFSFKDFIIK